MSQHLLRGMRRSWVRDLAAVLVLIAVWFLFYWRLFTPVEADRVQFQAGDYTVQYLTFRRFGYRELEAGRMPSWMPCIDSGYPYLADPQSSTFYPPAMLNYALHLLGEAPEFSFVAYELEATLHVLLAAILMYGFLRGETHRRASALAGALVFAYGGYLTGYPLLQTTMVEGAAWLPLALWGGRRLAQTGSRRALAASAFALALCILAGHVQTYTYVFLLFGLYFIYRAWREHLAWRRAFPLLIGTGLLAVALSATQFVPTFEYGAASTRTGMPFVESGTGFPLADVLQFVLTGAISLFQPLYVGLLPLVLMGAAIGAHRSALLRDRDVVFWAAVALAGLLLAFGGNLPIFDSFYWFAPTYRLFRSQERHALIVTAALAILTAYGADALLHSLSRPVRRWLRAEQRWFTWGLVLLAVALAVTSFLKWQGIDPSSHQQLPDRVALSFMACAAVTALLAARLNGAVRVTGIGVALIAILAIDLTAANRAIIWAMPYEPFPTQPSVTALLADASNSSALFRIHNEQRLIGHIVCEKGLTEVGGVTPIRVGHYKEFVAAVPREVRWQLLNVRYVVTWRGVLDGHRGQPIGATLLDQQGEGKDAIYTYRLAEEHPRAWIVHEAVVLPDRKSIYAALAAPDFDPRRVAYTQTPVAIAANQPSRSV